MWCLHRIPCLWIPWNWAQKYSFPMVCNTFSGHISWQLLCNLEKCRNIMSSVNRTLILKGFIGKLHMATLLSFWGSRSHIVSVQHCNFYMQNCISICFRLAYIIPCLCSKTESCTIGFLRLSGNFYITKPFLHKQKTCWY